MENVASIFIYHGTSVVVVTSQVKADWWGKGERTTFFAVLEIGGSTERPWCHVSALLHKHHSAALQHCWTPWSALCNHSWAVSWVSHAVFILRGHSWPVIDADLAVPESCEGMRQSWRAEAFVTSVESLEMQSGFSLCSGLGGAGRPVCSRGSAFPRQPSSLQEHRMRFGCKSRGCCATARASASSISFSGLRWHGWEATTAMFWCHF